MNQESTGWTELRVHGVSGTPPESELGHPAVWRVAGDALAGFYRRIWETRSGAADTDRFRREGYSWGALTSGDNRRALWLLLLPFMFVNLAFYMDPGHRVVKRALPDGRTASETRVVEHRALLQRLLALSLTGTYVLAATSASMDLVGWQCGKDDGNPACTGGGIWLSWLHYGWIDTTGSRLAVAALVPVALVLLLWWLANRSWDGLEASPVPQVEGRDPVVETLLEDRQLWNGSRPVRRLRALHVTAALGLTGVLLLTPLLPHGDFKKLVSDGGWGTWPGGVRDAVLVVLLTALAAAAAGMLVPRLFKRERPGPGDRTPAWDRVFAVLPWCALGLVVAAMGVAFLWDAADADTTRASAELPGQVGATRLLLAAQAALLLILLVSHLGTLWKARKQRAPQAPFGNPAFPRAAWHGLGTTGVALLAVLLATALAAGLTLRTAETLGAPAVAGQDKGGQRAMVVPTEYFWASVSALGFLAVALVVLGCAAWSLHRSARRYRKVVRTGYGEAAGDGTDATERRIKDIARNWARAQGYDSVGTAGLGVLLCVAGAIVVADMALDPTVGARLVSEGPGWLITVANLVLTGLVLVLLWAGRQAYRNPAFRRTVGILWDVGTFWPRATHPFAPPCYAERTVPDLLNRLEYLTGRPENSPGRVILSCHSQGTVIGAVVLMQADTAASTRTCFLTYGCPLTRLYVRFFPAYFNAYTVDRLGQILAHRGGELPGARDPGTAPRFAVDARWRNLYRLSDPIGSWVVGDPGQPTGVPPSLMDRQLRDPAAFPKPAGDSCYEKPKGHSDYFADPVFDLCVECCRGDGPAAPCDCHQAPVSDDGIRRAAVAGPPSADGGPDRSTLRPR
ncbi:hypothetical protein ABZT17_35320 [Streptomyces sp. NPDC005648]|uniref:hypothetical protein n=1 Tax=Streptomyces sp. NPDC005648 TaxID=3157044 RepID=UPI0033AE74DF